MKFLKIAFFEVQEWEQPFLEKELANHEIRLFNEALDDTSVDQSIENIAYYFHKIPSEVLINFFYISQKKKDF